jgi:hypothetical protein
MDRNELLLAIKEARKALREGADVRIVDTLAVFDGIAPFLDKNTVMNIKCQGCDSYARASFPLKDDFWAVENHSYCHTKMLSLKNLSLLKIMACQDFSQKARREMAEMAANLLEDLRVAFADKKLYDKNLFASFNVEVNLQEDNEQVCMELGHWSADAFCGSGIKLHLLRRLDPGFGVTASGKIAKVLRDRPILMAETGPQEGRAADLSSILEDIARRRKMDIVFI